MSADLFNSGKKFVKRCFTLAQFSVPTEIFNDYLWENTVWFSLAAKAFLVKDFSEGKNRKVDKHK